jgi:hypothetical protein
MAVMIAARTHAAMSRGASTPKETGTISAPTPEATLSQAVLTVVGRKKATYKKTFDREPY